MAVNVPYQARFFALLTARLAARKPVKFGM